MNFVPKETREISSTGDLKLGRLVASFFLMTSEQNHNEFVRNIEILGKIAQIELVRLWESSIPCYSIRLSKSILEDKNKIQEVVDNIQTSKLNESIKSELMTTIQKLTGYNITIGNKANQSLTASIQQLKM